MMKKHSAIAAALLLVSLTACKNKKNDPFAAVHDSDSTGIEIIRNTGRFRQLVWKFDTVFDIGAPGDSGFGRVRAHTVQVGDDGNIYVLDTDKAVIDIFDSTGTRVKRIKPDATNKLVIPTALVLQENGFGVYDVDNETVVRFSAKGDYLGAVTAPRQYKEGVLRNDGSAFILAQRVRDPKTDKPIMSIVRASGTDTMSVIAAEIDDAMQVQINTACGTVQMMLEPLFGGPPAWTAGHGMIAVAEAPLWGIRVYRGTREFKRIRRNMKPEEAGSQYAALAAEPGKRVPQPDGTVCQIPAVDVARAAGWKKVIPMIQAIALKKDGSMWVQRVDPGHSHPAVDIIDAKGEYVGTLPLMTPWPIGFLPNGNPVTLEDDKAGVTHIVAFRVNTNPVPVKQ